MVPCDSPGMRTQMATPQKLTGKDLGSDTLELKTEHLQPAALAWTEYLERENEIERQNILLLAKIQEITVKSPTNMAP